MAKLIFDPATGLPVRMLYDTTREQGQKVLTQEDFSDFREVAGIKLPYRTSMRQGGQRFADVTVKEAQVNLGLKSAELEKRP